MDGTDTSEAYLHYIRRQNTITEANAEATRGTITKAYEYALQECGTDRESGEIWQEYIAFIAEVRWVSRPRLMVLGLIVSRRTHGTRRHKSIRCGRSTSRP